MPRLLDLFCGAGGAAMGYHRAGFEVVGVDIKPQPHYPFEFHQADALTYPLEGFDAYHASPPCQLWTVAGANHRKNGKQYPDLITPTRERLETTGKPFIIENVPGAPLINPVKICGTMFGLRLKRHRLFECPFELYFHQYTCGCYQPGFDSRPNGKHRCYSFASGARLLSVSGHNFILADARLAMGIDWMNQGEISQAIPPAYTEYIGKYLMELLMRSK